MSLGFEVCFFVGELLKRSSPTPLQELSPRFYSTLVGKNVHLLSSEGAVRFGESVCAVRSLLDFMVSYADGKTAPASAWVPPPPRAHTG